ncbi:tellurite resistance TerB family protein [Segnochrobactrum spirostomi]|uniref:Tellurite resistance TerB family protein n=1 Tax=Segnochrobactrum spirostomi TaxID=2608987 RepID=A0A6A7Y2Y3_9HYPH|nr:tellurite resistance TerB family protein [Segnochrobactrum spirostomi]MQT13116.1 tellurite resistance TerB family protein [Segnochrobactrum spirostomi]
MPVKTDAPITHHDALIYAMVTLAAVDRAMTDAELGTIGELVSNLPVFADYDRERLVKSASTCGEILRGKDGLALVLDIINDALPPKLRETAYALAVEIAASDLLVDDEELRFLEMLRDRLDLDPLVVAAIERSARVRYRRAD